MNSIDKKNDILKCKNFIKKLDALQNSTTNNNIALPYQSFNGSQLLTLYNVPELPFVYF